MLVSEILDYNQMVFSLMLMDLPFLRCFMLLELEKHPLFVLIQKIRFTIFKIRDPVSESSALSKFTLNKVDT